MKKTYLALTLFICLAAMNLQAGVVLLPGYYQYSGDTSLSSDAFDRPIANGGVPDALSLDADSDAYDALTFQVTTSGAYNFLVTPVNDGFSSYLFLYQTSFDPTAPLTNVLAGESNNDTTSNLAATLQTNTTYIAVITGFSNFDVGAYSAQITEVVPEPSTFILLSTIVLFLVIARQLKGQSVSRWIQKSGH